MPHPIEVAQAISKHLGFEVYCDDVDVVDPRIDEANLDLPFEDMKPSTVGRVWHVTQNVYGLQLLNELRDGYLETVHIRT